MAQSVDSLQPDVHDKLKPECSFGTEDNNKLEHVPAEVIPKMEYEDVKSRIKIEMTGDDVSCLAVPAKITPQTDSVIVKSESGDIDENTFVSIAPIEIVPDMMVSDIEVKLQENTQKESHEKCIDSFETLSSVTYDDIPAYSQMNNYKKSDFVNYEHTPDIELTDGTDVCPLMNSTKTICCPSETPDLVTHENRNMSQLEHILRHGSKKCVETNDCGSFPTEPGVSLNTSKISQPQPTFPTEPGVSLNTSKISQSQPKKNSRISSEKKTNSSVTEDETVAKPFVCLHCSRRFDRPSRLRDHTRTHTGERPFACPHCERLFNQNSDLTKHIRTHTGETPYDCTFCDKSFKQKCSLTKHLRTHTGERPFSCSHCDKNFSQKSNLKVHMRSHTGEKPFACTYCDKKFFKKCDSVAHERLHSREGLLSCHHCDKKFIKVSHLQRHVRIHTTQKPFPCLQCEKRFNKKEDLNQHSLTHTDKKPFFCFLCDNRYSTRHTLMKHMQRHQ